MLNPILFTESVVGDFLKYQLTTYPLADARLHEQMRAPLEPAGNPRHATFSLSRAFRAGASLAELAGRGLLHPHISALSPHSHAYGHQEQAIEAIASGRTTLVATGTGSGKTECFLYPIISHCLRLRDQGAAPGIVAVLVYPMNALAEDQLTRMRALLAGSGVSFGMYVGRTRERAAEVTGRRLPAGSSRADYGAALRALQRAGKAGKQALHPPEERVSREEMRAPEGHPRILLTRQRDVELFDGADLRYVVFDEAHTLSGAIGGEAACLVRRLRAFCGKRADQVVCVATSATIADPHGGVASGREFASRVFGVADDGVELVGEHYEEDTWATSRSVSPPLAGDPGLQLHNLLDAVRALDGDAPAEAAVAGFQRTWQALTGTRLDPDDWRASLYRHLAGNELVYQLALALSRPRPMAELVAELSSCGPIWSTSSSCWFR